MYTTQLSSFVVPSSKKWLSTLQVSLVRTVKVAEISVIFDFAIKQKAFYRSYLIKQRGLSDVKSCSKNKSALNWVWQTAEHEKWNLNLIGRVKPIRL